MDDSGLLGSWKMISWKREFVSSGELTDVWGPDPVGFVSYGADGRVHALVASGARPRPAEVPLADAEKVRLFDTMLAYSGTYTLDREKVVHHVDISWNQIWTGTDQTRFYHLDGRRLTLSGAPAPDPFTGQDVVLRMTFEKQGV